MGHTATATITATQLSENVAVDLAITGGTAFTAASTLEVLFPREGKLLLVINSTYAGASTFTVTAGEFIGNGIGADVEVTAQDKIYIYQPSSTRNKDFDGMVNITFGTSNTGFVKAYYTV